MRKSKNLTREGGTHICTWHKNNHFHRLDVENNYHYEGLLEKIPLVRDLNDSPNLKLLRFVQSLKKMSIKRKIDTLKSFIILPQEIMTYGEK